MPMCGFNKKMIEGLRDFHLGLVETVLNKTLAEEGKKSSQEGN